MTTFALLMSILAAVSTSASTYFAPPSLPRLPLLPRPLLLRLLYTRLFLRLHLVWLRFVEKAGGGGAEDGGRETVFLCTIGR